MLRVASLVALALVLYFANPAVADTPTKSFEAIAQEAEQARQADRLSDALALYSQGVRLRSSWADGWWWLGSILYEQDRFAEAEVPFKRFLALSPKPGPAYAFLGLCAYEKQDYSQAWHYFEAWSKAGAPGNDALLDVAGYHWALLLTRGSRFNEALYLLAAKAQKLGESPALTEAMGLASLRMAYLPETYPRENREVVWLAGMAAFYSADNDVRRSNDFAARLLRHYGQFPNVHYFRGTLLSLEGRSDAAAEEFQTELQVSPHHAPALTEWAVCLVQAGRPAEALTPAKRAAVLEPENSRARYILGRALFETGSYQESADELEIAKRLAPDSSRVRFVLSKAYKQLGRQQESDRENAAFLALKDKEQVLAPLEQKLKSSPSKDAGPRP